MKIKVSLLTGGQDLHYALGLLSGLVQKNIQVDFIGNDAMNESTIVKDDKVTYYNLRGDQDPSGSIKNKILRVFKYYYKLLLYTYSAEPEIFHVLWLNKFIHIDRSLMNIYYKLLNKKIIYTAHDINYDELVGKTSLINKFTLAIMYRIVDHIIVHTKKMKTELITSFKVDKRKISIIPFGVNIVMPNTTISKYDSRRINKLKQSDKVILFFGNIAPYKGLEYLVMAMGKLKNRVENLKLIVAGRIKHGCKKYWQMIDQLILDNEIESYLIKRIEYIPEEEVEIYFKSADVLILPYRNIYQSGLIYTSYRFGLPVIASDVGSLRDDILEEETGFVCRPEDPDDLANVITSYFESDLYNGLESNRKKIIEFANQKFSWSKTSDNTYDLYLKILAN